MGYPLPEHRIQQLLSTNGDGTGTTNANGDYSVTPAKFYFEATEDTLLRRMIVLIEDATGMSASEYGNLNTALANGWLLQVLDADGSTVLSDLTAGVAVTTNAGLGLNCYDVDVKAWGVGNDLLLSRWTFERDSEDIFLTPGQQLAITFNDDLSGLVGHYFNVKGRQLINRPRELGTENYVG